MFYKIRPNYLLARFVVLGYIFTVNPGNFDIFHHRMIRTGKKFAENWLLRRYGSRAPDWYCLAEYAPLDT